MMRLKVHDIFLFLLAVGMLVSNGCDSKPTAKEGAGKLNLYVSVPPGAYLIDRVGGDKVDVKAVLRGGENPANYEPTARAMVALENSTAYFAMGLPFEKSFLKKLNAALPNLKKINMQEGIELRSITSEESFEHEHHGHSHGRDEADPHLWLSPKIADAQAKIVMRELSKLRPSQADYFAKNYAELSKELSALDAEIKAILAPMKGRAIFVHHPAFGYLADEYGLEQIAVEFEGKEPSPKRVDEFIKKAKQHNVSVIFVQPQFSTIGAKVIAKAIGASVVAIDPLERDLIASIRRIAEEIVSSGE